MNISFWQNSLRLSVGVALCLLILSPAAHALSVKADPLARRGCQPKLEIGPSRTLLAKYNYTLIGADSMETRTIATSLAWMERLSSRKTFAIAVASKETGYRIRYQNKTGNSAQRIGEIVLNRNNRRRDGTSMHYGENVAQMTHEIGHFIGNKGLYPQYYAAVRGQRCNVSGYSRSGRFNEQFAEVFAAYVTRPELIKDQTTQACKRAWNFFSKVVFDNPGAAELCIASQNEVERKLRNLVDAAPSTPGAKAREEEQDTDDDELSGEEESEQDATPARSTRNGSGSRNAAPRATATPAPAPSPSPSPRATATPAPKPAATPAATATPVATPAATATPTATADRRSRRSRPAAESTAAAVATPAPTPAPTATPPAKPAATPAPTPAPTPTAIPAAPNAKPKALAPAATPATNKP